MATTLEELDSFLAFVRRTTVGRVDGRSLEECMRQWREEQELAETIAAIKRGEENFAAGRSMSLAEAEHDFATKSHRTPTSHEVRRPH